jgi:hypothetical protein
MAEVADVVFDSLDSVVHSADREILNLTTGHILKKIDSKLSEYNGYIRLVESMFQLAMDQGYAPADGNELLEWMKSVSTPIIGVLEETDDNIDQELLDKLNSLKEDLQVDNNSAKVEEDKESSDDVIELDSDQQDQFDSLLQGLLDLGAGSAKGEE